ncbi:hydroxyatrazine ethylaminohydrolase [Longimycelium tulufanense]|uniref:Hydroxyatrazine ethylaminohydrolase n=1 Tax=Longimycelium tulufanense TaxID=907463 RepID=A0A8J3CA97_9PSEU|nr:8-oxoguanine deaminase [Longimycelium tulufanense]GGM36271.1 hydroxyatrazine ethylaminohydrolase [Longimycelium tulufanense]
MRTVIEGAAVVTMDGRGSEYPNGHVVVDHNRITAVGAGHATPGAEPGVVVDGEGCLVTPGLVNTHHHLFQGATRGYASDNALFDWLTALYPMWTALDEDVVHAAAMVGLAWLARSGCTTVADHHYLFPRCGGDMLGAVVNAAQQVGMRLHLVRGSMDRGRSRGGLPPDELVEDTETALIASESAITRYHDPAPDALVRVALGPCSLATASADLLGRAADLARRNGVQLHSHLGETWDERERCRTEFGRTPTERFADLGLLGGDVWLAHGIHLSRTDIEQLAASGTGIAHCPSSNARLGSGIAPVRALLDAGVAVGLGVDGAACNEAARLGNEPRMALYLARLRDGVGALGVREALWLATMGGARCLGRSDEIGSLEPGKLADLALWRVDGIDHAGIADPVAALVLGELPPLELLLVGGRPLARSGQLVTVEETEIARNLAAASHRVANR